jgi:cytochrome c oxidase cbb3-type subunit 1
MKVHASIIALAGLGALVWLVYRLIEGLDGTREKGYNNAVIKAGVIASVFWGLAGFLAGDALAWQMVFPALNFDLPWTNFGRLRPFHTSAVIFAFGGNVLIATSFFVVQRTCCVRLAGQIAPWFVFWGYQLFIVLAATGYLLGITQSKEYAEPEWYVDLWLTVVWVVYLLVFLATVIQRKEPHIYVANWFYLAFIVTVAMLHLVNNATVPVRWTSTKSYILWSGVQDAMTQWW